MRVWELHERFGLDRLRLTEREARPPGPGQVAVRLRAASLNYRDLLMVEGRYNPKQPLPLVPLSDGAGEIETVGPAVTRVAPGERVMSAFAPGWIAGEPARERLRATLGGPLDGVLAERVLLDAEGVVPVPAHLSFEEAACLPCAAVTAWNAVTGAGGLVAGETLLVLGTGGVSLFALQIGRLLGARVVVTSSSDEKLERALSLGASDVVNYRTHPDWDTVVKDLTGGRGVDRVVEVGGAGTLTRSLRAVRTGGTISLVGNLAGLDAQVNLALVFMRAVTVRGVLVGSRESFEAMSRAIAFHRLRPVVDRVFPFEDAPAAFAHLESGSHFGKIVIRFA
jgi:NADPH:quinone reductase-like Zn-dependent oxidoreductase